MRGVAPTVATAPVRHCSAEGRPRLETVLGVALSSLARADDQHAAGRCSRMVWARPHLSVEASRAQLRAELRAPDLATDGLGKFVDEVDLAGVLVGGGAAFDELLEFVGQFL